jgi:hypothetical protein
MGIPNSLPVRERRSIQPAMWYDSGRSILTGRMSQKWAKLMGMLLGLGVLSGCGSSGGGGGSTPAPTATLTAIPGTIIAGQGNSTLTFTSTNADTGVIDNGLGTVGLNSHVSVAPLVTTTYTYKATGAGGSATAQATVTVTPPGPAPTVSLSASPASVFAGQSTTLTWASTNATSVVIDNNIGGVQPASGGSHDVSPTQTTTYTITAFGNGQQKATATATVTVSPVNSFDGLVQDPTTSPRDVDPNGAVGTKQFMEYVNTEYQAYNKITFQPVWPSPQPIGTPWSAISPPSPCAGTNISLDAVINFDRLASRWVIAARSFDAPSHHYYFCIAVSNTDDLSSSSLTWYAYSDDLAPYIVNPATMGFYVPDWAKLGTWPDAYYATIDLLQAGVEVGVVACAFDRTNMLTHGTANLMQCVQVPAHLDNGVYLSHSLIPADVDGTTPPPPGRDEFMVSIQNPPNDQTTTLSTTINVWDFHVDWTTPANSTFNLVSSPTVTTYTPGCYLYLNSAATTNCVPEPQAFGVVQHIDSVGDRLMPRFGYRNFGTYESFLVSHTVQTATTDRQTGVRWYELRDNLAGIPSVFQSGTINPDTALFRFLPSIAQDKVGNTAVGYSVSSFSSDPGIDFSYWSLASPNASPGEVTILNGSAEEVTPPPGYGEWGSYSSMTVDPIDDCTFWYVNEYWTLLAGQTNSSWATRIANFKMPTCQ